MLRQVEFSKIADEFADRYRRYLEIILNSYNSVILSGEMNNRKITSFSKEIANIQSNFLTNEVSKITSAYEWITEAVTTDVGNDDIFNEEEWLDYVEANTSFLYDIFKVQSTKDAIYATNFLRSKVLQVRNLNEYQLAHNLIYNSRDLGFFYTDKLGRKVNAVKYIRTMARDYLVKNYNDLIYGYAMINNNVNLVVDHLDEGHKHNGIQIDTETSHYFDIKDDVFHPNSNALLRIA